MANYQKLEPSDWEERQAFFWQASNPCKLCPRTCMVKRSEGRKGICLADANVKIASFNLHHGEEPPVSARNGSGTIFFSGCTLKCVFCQNYPISQLFNGEYYDIEGLAGIMLSLQDRGAHNINLVSPTPYLPQIVEALQSAAAGGLHIPIVYNTSGFERPEMIEHLDGLVDIYMPDIKYSDDHLSQQFSGVSNYVSHAFDAVDVMYKQVGGFRMDELDVGTEGVIIRHLILPGQMENSREVLRRISLRPWPGFYLSLMSQYFPAHKACDTDLKRRISTDEYRMIRDYAWTLGFRDGWFQDI